MKIVVADAESTPLVESANKVSVSVRVISGPKNWIESEAVRQLESVSRTDGMLQAFGYPDLHPGKGSPVGAAFVSRDIVHPFIIGGDIGCGMGLFQTDLIRRKVKLDRWTDRLRDLENPWDGDVRSWLQMAGLQSSRFDSSLGTIGLGNHFAELQAVEKVADRDSFTALGLDKESLFILAHSGSRGMGESILREFLVDHSCRGVRSDSLAGSTYLAQHDMAVNWARMNRALICHRFAEALGATTAPVWDGCHNSISLQEFDGENVWLHRKGAAPTDSGIVMIPGSRGTLSYLVKVVGNPVEFGWSVSHGAGRKWTRSESRKRIREGYRPPQLVQTGLGGRVICEDRDLLYEEAPDVYKKIEVVVQDLVDAGIVSVIASFKPLITYKTRALRR